MGARRGERSGRSCLRGVSGRLVRMFKEGGKRGEEVVDRGTYRGGGACRSGRGEAAAGRSGAGTGCARATADTATDIPSAAGVQRAARSPRSRILLLHIHLRNPLRTRAGPGRDIRTSGGDPTGREAGGERNEGEKASLACREGRLWFGSTCVRGGGTWEKRGGNKALTRLGRMDGAGWRGSVASWEEVREAAWRSCGSWRGSVLGWALTRPVSWGGRGRGSAKTKSG